MRSRKSCLVFRVCGNYALMRVVHCGVLAARASLFIWIVHAVGSCLHTSCFDQNPTHARDHREGCKLSVIMYNLYFAYNTVKKKPSLAVW